MLIVPIAIRMIVMITMIMIFVRAVPPSILTSKDNLIFFFLQELPPLTCHPLIPWEVAPGPLQADSSCWEVVSPALARALEQAREALAAEVMPAL